jgi:hypothetical protein
LSSWVQGAELVFSEAEIGHDSLNSGSLVWVQSRGSAHDEKTLEVPCKDITAVIDDKSVFIAMHHVPSLLIGKAEIGSAQEDSLAVVVALASISRGNPDLFTLLVDHVEDCSVVDLGAVCHEGLLGALEAIVGWVVALNDIPVASQSIVTYWESFVSWGTACSVVVGIGRGQGEALVVNQEAAHHGVIDGRGVGLRTVESAHGVFPAASGASEVRAASAIGQASRDLIRTVSLDAGNVLDGESVTEHMVHVVKEDGG